MTDPGARPIERPHQTKQNTRNAPTGDAFTLCKLPSSSGALPVNDADERLLVDPDLRSHAEERPDPKTNPDPESEVVRARARRAASCGMGGAERHPERKRDIEERWAWSDGGWRRTVRAHAAKHSHLDGMRTMGTPPVSTCARLTAPQRNVDARGGYR